MNTLAWYCDDKAVPLAQRLQDVRDAYAAKHEGALPDVCLVSAEDHRLLCACGEAYELPLRVGGMEVRAVGYVRPNVYRVGRTE